MPSTGDDCHLALRTSGTKEVDRLMMFVCQSHWHNQMTSTDNKLRYDHSGDMKLLQSNLTTLFYLSLILAVLCVFQFIRGTCTSIFELYFSTKNPFRCKLIVESQYKTGNGYLVMTLFGITFLMPVKAVNTIILKLGYHLAITSKTEFVVTNCVRLSSLCSSNNHCA